MLTLFYFLLLHFISFILLHMYRVAQKTGTLCSVRLNFIQIQTTFQTYFTVRISTFVITLSIKITPHLKCVSLLPCEMSVSEKQQVKTRRLL